MEVTDIKQRMIPQRDPPIQVDVYLAVKSTLHDLII